jgi:Tfp pilus assembly protein PilX
LIVALVFLVVLTVAGVTASRFATFEERMASNSQFRNQVFQQAQSEIRAQMLDFNTSLAKRAPLLTAMGQPTTAKTAAAKLADPTLLVLPDTVKDKVLLTPKMSYMNTATNNVRYLQDKPCDDGSSIDKFVCIGFELNAKAELTGGSNSWQSQGLSFQNAK